MYHVRMFMLQVEVSWHLSCQNVYGIDRSIVAFIMSECLCYRYKCRGIYHVRMFMLQIEVSWNVSTGASGVHDFHIGIASERTSIPDVMDFTSTHGHQTKRLYHPHLFNGEQFYLMLKSTSKSDVTDVKVGVCFIN